MNAVTAPPVIARSRTRRSRLLPWLAAPALILALAGCAPGGAGVDGQKSSGSSSAAAGAPSTEAEFSAARDAYDLKLAQCFREKGLDVKDPVAGQGITESSPEIQAAYPDCAAEIGDPPMQSEINIAPDDLEKLLDRATCLREMGYEIQEPTANDPGFIPSEVSAEDFDTCRTGAGL